MSLDIEVVAVGEAGGLERAAERAAAALADGQLVLHPTETVYGIGGDGHEASNRAIARIKGRSPEQPLLVLIPNVETLRRAFPRVVWSAAAERLAARFWPGPLTLVLPCADVPYGLGARDGGLAARVSPDPVVGAILKRWGKPMTSTSANRSGEGPSRTASAALRIFEPEPELGTGVRRVVVVDDGAREEAAPSTIVSLVVDPPHVVREGPVSGNALRSCLAGSE